MRFFTFVTICGVVLGCAPTDDESAAPARDSSVPSAATTSAREADSTTESAAAGMSLVHYYAGSDARRIAAAFEYDLVVTGVVGSVANIPATNDDPPLVTIRIDRVLQGKSPGDHIDVIWEPFPHDVDYNVPEKEPRYKAWAKTPMDPPVADEEYVLMLNVVQAGPHVGDYSCCNIARFPLSEDVVLKVVRGLEERIERRER